MGNWRTKHDGSVPLALGTFLGWMYSLPPLALAWKGWRELDNAVMAGIALPLFGFAVWRVRSTFLLRLPELHLWRSSH